MWIAYEDVPTVVAGDFNVETPSSAELSVELYSRNWVVAAICEAESRCEQPPWTYHRKKMSRLDLSLMSGAPCICCSVKKYGTVTIALGRITKCSARFYVRSVTKPIKSLRHSGHEPLEPENLQSFTTQKWWPMTWVPRKLF